MKNTRIGFAKKEVCEGAQEPTFINEEVFKISEVVDPRFVWSVINIQQTKKVRFIKQVKGGTFLVSSIPFDNRDDDNYSIWTYFPQGIEVSQKQLLEIIRVVDSYLTDRTKSDDELKALAETEYPVHLVEDIPASTGTGIAFVDCVGDDALYKYLGDGRSQSSYVDVKAIILKEEGVEIRKESEDVKNYSNSPVIEKYAFLAPDSELLGSQEDKYRLFVVEEEGKQTLFPGVLYVKKGSTVRLKLERKNFETKLFDIPVISYEQKCSWKQTEWEKNFKLSDFKVTVDPSGEPAKNVKITINDVVVDDKNGITLTEDEAKKVSITIEADGCDTNSQKVSILSSVQFKLRRKEKTFSWDVVAYGGKEEMTIRSRYVYDQSESPLEWYVMGRNEVLHFDYRRYNKEKKSAVAIGIVIGAVLVIAAWLLHHYNVDSYCFSAISHWIQSLK